MLDALGVERAVVVGHSMGAFVALVLGDLYPERVSRLVLVDGGLPLASRRPRARRHAGGGARAHAGTAGHAFATVGTTSTSGGGIRRSGGTGRPIEEYLAYDLVGEEPELRQLGDAPTRSP